VVICVCSALVMEKKKFMSRAALILNNALEINRQQRLNSETSGKGKENDNIASPVHRRSSTCKAKRRLFDHRRCKYVTSTPKVIGKVSLKWFYAGGTCLNVLTFSHV